MELKSIITYIDQVCDNISSILEVDVTIVSKDLVRIAGTGVFKDKIGESISEESMYKKVIEEGQTYVIDKEIEYSCTNCSCRDKCKELADICTPIQAGEQVVGILGMAAFNEQQKHKILSKNEEMIQFINSMSNLISYKLEELYKKEIKSIDELEKEAIQCCIEKYGTSTEGMKKSSKCLNIGIATLYRKIKKYNIKY